MDIVSAARVFVEATVWADECREYTKKYIVGRRWDTTTGDRDAIKILMRAENEEYIAKKALESAVNDRERSGISVPERTA